MVDLFLVAMSLFNIFFFSFFCQTCHSQPMARPPKMSPRLRLCHLKYAPSKFITKSPSISRQIETPWHWSLQGRAHRLPMFCLNIDPCVSLLGTFTLGRKSKSLRYIIRPIAASQGKNVRFGSNPFLLENIFGCGLGVLVFTCLHVPRLNLFMLKNRGLKQCGEGFRLQAPLKSHLLVHSPAN